MRPVAEVTAELNSALDLSWATSYDAARRDQEEPEDPLHPSFQSDRERITTCKAFRRLKHKTQVFWAPRNDHFRTRLSHSLEVSNIARAIGRQLRLNLDLTEAIALGHDLGHTPFGHAGERALRNCLAKHNLEFHHNKQSAKICRYTDDWRITTGREVAGLNLCPQVLDGIVTHPFNWPIEPSTQEGRVVHCADTIAYVCHDFEDFVESHLEINGSILGAYRRLGERYYDRVNLLIADVVETSLGEHKVGMSEARRSACKDILQVIHNKIYTSGEWRRREEGARQIVESLFGYWTKDENWADITKKKHLPQVIMDRIIRSKKPIVIIADFIAGMTDTYALEQYRTIFSPEVVDYYW